MSHWNNTHQPPSYPHGSVTANFMHNGYTGNPWSSLPTTSPYPEDNNLIYSQENHPKLPFSHDRHYQLPVPKTKLPISNLRSPAKSRRPAGAPPPYSAVDDDVPPLPLPSFNHPNYPFPPPTSFNNCSFHYNGIPKENPLWAAPRNKLYDINRSAGDDQLAPIPITRKQSVRIGGFACGKTLDTGQPRRNLSTRASRRDKFLPTAVKRAPQSSSCTKKAPDSVSIGREESTTAGSRSIKTPSALKTRKTRATQIMSDLKDNSTNKDAYSSTTSLRRTKLRNREIHGEDLLGLLAAEPSKLETCSFKNDNIKTEKFASDYRIISRPKSAPKRNARNIFKLKSQHKGEVAIKSKLEMRRSEIAYHVESNKEDRFREESRPEAENTNIQLAESITSLQKIYCQELRKMQSTSSSHTFAKTCSQLRTSRSCPHLAKKRSNLRKSMSFCFGQALDIPVAPLHSQVIASSHKIDSVKRAIAELLKRDLSKEAVDVVTVANREYYVMPVICSMPRTPMNVNTRNSWRTFQCCPSCCTTGCEAFNQIAEPPNTPSHQNSKSLNRSSCSAKSGPVSKSPSNVSIEDCSFEIIKASANHLTCPSTFKADFLGYHEGTECGTEAQPRPFGTPADDENKNILDLNPITLTPPSTSKNGKSVGDLVSLLGTTVPRPVTPVLCYTCRTCCSKPPCCSRSCSPCRFPCPPQCPPRCYSPCAPCCPPPCPPRSCSPCARACPPCCTPCGPCSPCGSCSPICRPYCPPPVPPRPLCQCPPPPPPVPPPNRQCVTAPCCYPNSCSPPCSSPKDTCSSPSCSARCPQACSPSPPPCPFPRPCYRPPTPDRCLPCQPAYRPCQPDDACYPLPPLCCPRPPSPCKVPQCNPCSPPPCCPPPWCCDPCCPPRCPSPKKYCPRPCSPPRCSWDPCYPYPCIPPCPPSPCRSPCYSPPRCPPTYCPPGYCSVCCKYPCCCPRPRCCPRPCPPACTVYPCPAPPSSLCKPCPPSSCCRPCSPCRRPWSPPCSPCRPQCPPCQPYCSSRPCSPYCAPPRPPPCVPKRRRCCAPCGFTCPAPCPPPCPSPLCRRCCGKKRRRKRKCCCCLDENPNFVFPPYKPYSVCKQGCFCPEASYEPFPGCCP